MKRIFCFLLMLIIIPSCCFAAQEILVSESAGSLLIPDGFYEIPSDKENERLFYNSQGEAVLISIFHLKDIYPLLYENQVKEGKIDEPFYRNGGELAGVISKFVEDTEGLGVGFDIRIGQCGECAAVYGETDLARIVTVINRYEVVSVLVTYANPYSSNAFSTLTLFPQEQDLK